MKLTKDMRNRIVINAVIGVLKKRHEALDKESNALAILVYDQIYPTDIQTQMAKLPDEFFQQNSVIRVEIDCEDIVLKMTSSRKVSAVDSQWHRPRVKLEELSDAKKKRICAFSDAQKALLVDTNNLKTKLRTLLNGITTMKRLREEWPDGAEYYKDQMPTPPIQNLPAVRGIDVTALIRQLESLHP